MSLVMLYRDCLTADKRVRKDNYKIQDFNQLSKIYLSPDKRFAGGGVGRILTPSQWELIRNLLDIRRIKNESRPLVEDLENTMSFVDKESHYVLVYGKTILEIDIDFNISKECKFTISHLTKDDIVVLGSGQPAAKVLINSGKAFNQQQFFKIVSIAESDVSSEYEFIELKNVIDSPWYKR